MASIFDLWKQRVAATRATSSTDASAAPATAASSSSRSNPSPSGWREWLSKRHWGVAAGIAIVFVASLTTVTLIELVGQQPLASISGNEPSGNTSIGSLFDDDSEDTPVGCRGGLVRRMRRRVRIAVTECLA